MHSTSERPPPTGEVLAHQQGHHSRQEGGHPSAAEMSLPEMWGGGWFWGSPACCRHLSPDIEVGLQVPGCRQEVGDPKTCNQGAGASTACVSPERHVPV